MTFPPFTGRKGFRGKLTPESDPDTEISARASDDIEERDIATLRDLLEASLLKEIAGCERLGILLSGGLDSSVLLSIAARKARPLAVTAAFEGREAPDVEYAKIMAKRYGLEHVIHRFKGGELCEAVDDVIRTMKTFDPMEIRNDVTIDIAMKAASLQSIKKVITGDGCDELFGGYTYLFELDREGQGEALSRLAMVRRFSSKVLAERLGMEVISPFLDDGIRQFAQELPLSLKIRKVEGEWIGKWIVRKAYENDLPGEVVWRPKVPIEEGSGTSELPEFFDERISDEEFSEKRDQYLRRDKVAIRDKEHLFYYEIFRCIFGPPRPVDTTERTCPGCSSNLPEGATFCRTCGAWFPKERLGN